jgi:hypothetical protein
VESAPAEGLLVAGLPHALQGNGPREVLSGRNLLHDRGPHLLLLSEEDEARREGGNTDDADDEGSDRRLPVK